MWITLIQTRHFFAGETSPKEEFVDMYECIKKKKLSQIVHSECPQALWAPRNTSKVTFDPNTRISHTPPGTPTSEDRKKLKWTEPSGNKEAEWHPQLKKVFEPALRKANHPPFWKIWKQCKFVDHTIPGWDRDSDTCLSFASIGRCSRGKYCNSSYFY